MASRINHPVLPPIQDAKRTKAKKRRKEMERRKLVHYQQRKMDQEEKETTRFQVLSYTGSVQHTVGVVASNEAYAV